MFCVCVNMEKINAVATGIQEGTDIDIDVDIPQDYQLPNQDDSISFDPVKKYNYLTSNLFNLSAKIMHIHLKVKYVCNESKHKRG